MSDVPGGKAPWAEERKREGQFPLGPWNVASNLSYAIGGVYLALRYQDASAALMAVALVILATGSALFHAYGSAKDDNSRRLDWIGMLAVAGMGVGHGIPASDTLQPLLMAGGALLGVGVYWLHHWQSQDWWIVAALVVASIYPVLDGAWRLVLVSWASAAVAYLVWTLDRWETPPLGDYGHGLWHCLMALAAVVLYIAQVVR